MKHTHHTSRTLLAALSFTSLLTNLAAAEPIANLTGGQTGHIEFMASNPEHRWALIRGRLGPQQVIAGDLLMPKNVTGKVPVMVMSHGSDGMVIPP